MRTSAASSRSRFARFRMIEIAGAALPRLPRGVSRAEARERGPADLPMSLPGSVRLEHSDLRKSSCSNHDPERDDFGENL
jgi:hypothetical protein